MTREGFLKLVSKLKLEIDDYTYGNDILESDYIYDNNIKIEVVDEGIIDQSRWSISKYIIVKIEDNFYINISWEDPATEMQEGQPTMCEIFEVKPVKETVVRYVSV